MSTLIRGVKRLCVVYSRHPSVRTADKSTFRSFDSVLMTETTEKIGSMLSSSRCYLMDEVAHNTTTQKRRSQHETVHKSVHERSN